MKLYYKESMRMIKLSTLDVLVVMSHANAYSKMAAKYILCFRTDPVPPIR